jgi:hypothetical protein
MRQPVKFHQRPEVFQLAKSPLEAANLIAQDCVARTPVIILGSGASVPYGIPGMPGLQSHFLKISPPPGCSSTDQTAWSEFLAQLKVTDLESALDRARLSDPLAKHIVETTWEFLAPFDHLVFDAAIRTRGMFPLTRLYKHLLQSTHVAIDVITPNYDRIAEYAADVGEICHYTGFGYGHLRIRARGGIPRVYVGGNPARCVNIWKVHGSFDWFKDQDGVVVALPTMSKRPAGFDPVMVTPGIEKYRLTHEEPFLTIKQGADSALQSAKSYLCIGYGFNDPHIQTKLVERCQIDAVPLILITKEITKSAHEFLSSDKCRNFLALEDHADGSKMYSKEHPAGHVLVGKKIWQLDQFLGMVMS